MDETPLDSPRPVAPCLAAVGSHGQSSHHRAHIRVLRAGGCPIAHRSAATRMARAAVDHGRRDNPRGYSAVRNTHGGLEPSGRLPGSAWLEAALDRRAAAAASACPTLPDA